MTSTLQALSLVEKVEPVQVPFTLRLRDRRNKWMQNGCKVYMDSYMASNESWFMITWTIFKNHLLEVGPTQSERPWHSECSQPLFILFYHVWGPAWIEFCWNSTWLRIWSHMAFHYTWGSVTTLYDFGGVLGWPLETFIWALTILWSRCLARVWSGPEYMAHTFAC